MNAARRTGTVALCLAVLTGAAMAQDAQDSFEPGDPSRRGVMVRSGQPCATAIAFLQGHLAGRSGQSALSPAALSGKAAAFPEGCLDRPDALVLSAMDATSKD